MTPRQKIRLSETALFLENWVFPLIFAYFCFVHVNVLLGFRHAIFGYFRTCLDDGLDLGDVNFTLFLLLRVLLIAMNVAFAVGLTTRERTDHQFEDWREVVVPLAATFVGFLAGALLHQQSRINVQLLPASMSSLLSSLGLAIVVSGALISVAAAWQLKRSFSVYVESHSVVDSGVYSMTRHPMYVGHGLRLVGYCLMNGFLMYILLSAATLALLVYRARLEERRLSRTEPGYRAYARRTPRFLSFGGSPRPRSSVLPVAVSAAAPRNKPASKI